MAVVIISLVTLFLLVITTLLVCLLFLHKQRLKFKHVKNPPLSSMFYHPFGYILGHASLIQNLQIDNPTWIFDDILGHLFKSLETKTFVMFFFNRSMLFTTDIAKVSIILSDHATFKKDEMTKVAFDHIAGARLMGNLGILTNAGDEIWYWKRKILDTAFHKKYLKNTFDGMLFVANKVVDCIEDNFPEGKEFDLYPILGRTALEVICRCGFSIESDLIAEKDPFLLDAVAVVFKTVSIFFENIFSFNMPWCFRDEKKKVRYYLKGLRKYLSDYAMSRITNEDESLHTSDILSYIIKANSLDDRFTVEDVVDELLTFFVAGMETTTNTMSFFIYNMYRHPHVYVKVKAEVDQVFGCKEDLEYSDLNKLVFLEQAIRESMRVSTVVESTGRSNIKDVVVDGLFIPNGTVISIPQSQIHMDPDIWHNPHVYDPDRFAPGKTITPFTYMPFMAGPRACIGKHFAMLEMKIVLAKLIKAFDFMDPHPDNPTLECVSYLTRKPKHGMPVVFKHRS